MKPAWVVVTLAQDVLDDNYYCCYGCAMMCTYTGKFKPATCTGTPITETFD
jgi:hypothetical protein